MHTCFRRDWRLVFFLLSMLVLPSCSAKRGDVHGKVNYKGRPVIYGSVVLIGSDDMPVTGLINSDGTYLVSGVPAGAVRVAVVSPDPATPVFSEEESRRKKALVKGKKIKPSSLSRKTRPVVAPEVDRRKWFPLPQQYQLADNSGITTTIHEGDNTFDIDLK